MKYENKWLYYGKPVEEIEKKYLGFVYLIEDTETGRRYVGKKFTKVAKKKPGQRRRVTVDSDWRTYWSSNDFIKAEAKKNPSRFKREILHFCLSRGETNFVEVEECIKRHVLRSDDYLNEHISSRWYKKNVIKYPSLHR